MRLQWPGHKINNTENVNIFRHILQRLIMLEVFSGVATVLKYAA